MRLRVRAGLVVVVDEGTPLGASLLVVGAAKHAGDGALIGDAPVFAAHELERDIDLVGLGVPVEHVVLDRIAGAGIVAPAIREVALEHVLCEFTGIHVLILLFAPPVLDDGSRTVLVVGSGLFNRQGRILETVEGRIVLDGKRDLVQLVETQLGRVVGHRQGAHPVPVLDDNFARNRELGGAGGGHLDREVALCAQAYHRHLDDRIRRQIVVELLLEEEPFGAGPGRSGSVRTSALPARGNGCQGGEQDQFCYRFHGHFVFLG